MYTCAECGGPVELVDGEVIRECEHDEAAVIASVSATVYGEGLVAS